MLISAVGNAIATGTLKTGARFFAMFLMPMGSISACKFGTTRSCPMELTITDTILVSWTVNSFPRPLVKRAAAIAITNMLGTACNIYGAYMYPSSDSPRYIAGGSANSVICLCTALTAGLLRWIHIRENKKLERAEAEAIAAGHPDIIEDSFQETRQPGFRYIL